MVNISKQIFFLIANILRAVLDKTSRVCMSIIYCLPRKKIPPIENPILKVSALSLAKSIRTNEIKCIDVMNAFINRIQEVNPILNMVVDERFEEARKDAKLADELIASGTKTVDQLLVETPLLGLPFTTKDSVGVKGLSWTAGLLSLKGRKAEEDSTVIQILKKAGAIPIAITNVPELCMWYESYNHIYGRTRNPYDTNRIPGGSSGGEGVNQAIAGSAFGVGTDIGGSIRMPCFFNGIFGHKGSPGIISNEGYFPNAPGERGKFLATGPMVRHASDLLPLVKIMSKGTELDLKLGQPVDVTKLKIYYIEAPPRETCVSAVDTELVDSMKQAVRYFKEMGVPVKEVHFPQFRHSMDMWSASLQETSPMPYTTLMATGSQPFSLLKEFLKWPIRQSSFTFISLGIAFFEEVLQQALPPPEALLDKVEILRKELVEMLGDDGILLYQSHPRIAPYHHEPYFKYDNASFTMIFNILKLPVTQCPLGLNREGLPLGLQVVANECNDHLTIAVAQKLEEAFGGWVAPN